MPVAYFHGLRANHSTAISTFCTYASAEPEDCREHYACQSPMLFQTESVRNLTLPLKDKIGGSTLAGRARKGAPTTRPGMVYRGNVRLRPRQTNRLPVVFSLCSDSRLPLCRQCSVTSSRHPHTILTNWDRIHAAKGSVRGESCAWKAQFWPLEPQMTKGERTGQAPHEDSPYTDTQ
jgi:hypothetical protein